MFGKTNSFVVSGADGGGCDFVYAVNETGRELAAGDTVWLNQPLYDNVSNAFAGYTSSCSVPFNIGNQMFVNKSSKVCRLDYNAGTNGWSYVNVCDMLYDDYVMGVNYRNGKVWVIQTNGKSYLCKNSGELVYVYGLVLSADKVLSRATGRLTTYDAETGVVNSDEGFQIANYTSINIAHMDGNRLYMQKGTTENYLYDISDYAAPVLLGKPVYTMNNIYARYVTGLTQGCYVMATETYVTEKDTAPFYIYKIGSGFAWNLADDLPASLHALMGKNCRFSYNADTKVLIVGTSQKLFFYRLENGAFEEFFIDIDTMPATQSKTAYLARLSDDMASIAITCIPSSARYAYIYRLKNLDDNWRAENWERAHALSLMGYATGKKNDEGLYEIKTLLPEVCRYTLVCVPEPDVIEFMGDAK